MESKNIADKQQRQQLYASSNFASSSAALPFFSHVDAENVYHSAPTISGFWPVVSTTDASTFQIPDPHSDQLSFSRKVIEFCSAPITRYYLHFIFYLLFMGCLIHESSVYYESSSLKPTEIAVHAYVYVYLLDKIREIIFTFDFNLKANLRQHFKNVWNIFDHVMCWAIIGAFIVRYVSLSQNAVYPGTRAWITLCCSLWSVRVLGWLKIWSHVGPVVYVMWKMLSAMISLMILFFVTTFVLGTMRQGIMLSWGNFNFTKETIRDFLMEPYFMPYSPYAAKSDPSNWDPRTYGNPFNFLVPIGNIVYLLALSTFESAILVSIFNDIYSDVQAESQLVYKFMRHAFIIEYQTMPLLPPPLTVFSWLYQAIRYVYRRIRFRKWQLLQSDHNEGHKLFLSREEIEKLHDFEENCVERYNEKVRQKEMQERDDSINNLNKSIADISDHVDKITRRQNVNKANVLTHLSQVNVEWTERLDKLVNKLNDRLRTLEQLSNHRRISS